MSIGVDSFPGHASMQLWKISHGNGRFDPIGCVLILRRVSSIGSLES